MANSVVFLKTLAAASATNIATSQAASAGTPLTLNGTAVSGGVATIDTFNVANNTAIGRRVLITSTSGAETASIMITGTNASNAVISETITFSGSSTTVQSNLDYVTVTKIVPSGTIVGSLSAVTNGIGSSPCIQYTYSDPNNLLAGTTFPLAFNASTITNQSSTIDGATNIPLTATRILVNSGTGTIRVRMIQAGIG